MATRGEVKLGDVWAMLKKCAPGHTIVEYKHSFCVRYLTHTYPSLPTGRHGTGDHRTIEKGHVRKMAKHLHVLDCAKGELSLL